MKKTRKYCYIPLHDEVKEALVDWTHKQSVDIAFVPLVRFMISYAHTNHIRSDYDQRAIESIRLLDITNSIASDHQTNGRTRERVQTTSQSIIQMNEEERYISLLCAMHALDVIVDELVI